MDTAKTILRINQGWVVKKMKEHKLRLKKLSIETGIQYTYLHQRVTGVKKIEPLMKAVFYFYFKSKEQ